jgi:hypothetical protein
MYSGNTVSYLTIVDKVFRDFGFKYDINDEEVLEWLAEFMAHTNSGITMEDKISYLEVCDGRANLPIDLHKIKQTVEVSGAASVEDAKCGKGRMLPMRWSTDNFHMRYHKDSRDYTTQSANTYTVGQGFIFPSFSKGMIAISYEAIPTDDCGYPTIPAEQQWLEAAAHYIAYKIAKKLWLRDEIRGDKYQIIERDKEWYFAQAVNFSKQWNGVDDAESFKNQHVRTIPSIQDHASFFANMQLPEQRYFRPKAGGNINNTPNSTGVQSLSNRASNNPNVLPVLVTGVATLITATSAKVTSQLTSYGSVPITNHGNCWSTLPNPTTSDSVSALGAISAPAAFSTNLTGLTTGTTYYVRSFATTATGTSYGNQTTFTTL